MITFLGSTTCEKHNRTEVIILTEYCPAGSLLDLMHRRANMRLDLIISQRMLNPT